MKVIASLILGFTALMIYQPASASTEYCGVFQHTSKFNGKSCGGYLGVLQTDRTGAVGFWIGGDSQVQDTRASRIITTLRHSALSLMKSGERYCVTGELVPAKETCVDMHIHPEWVFPEPNSNR